MCGLSLPTCPSKSSSSTVNPGSTVVKTIPENTEGQNWTSGRTQWVPLSTGRKNIYIYHIIQKTLGSAVWVNCSECFPPSQSVSVRKSMCSLNEKWFFSCVNVRVLASSPLLHHLCWLYGIRSDLVEKKLQNSDAVNNQLVGMPGKASFLLEIISKQILTFWSNYSLYSLLFYFFL